ncbi:BnaA09g20110D [Brassica napus]|uniref:BnaA09g20110D protein n=1 Tax=Brassica napus TaxID=3708 RepID=A0A078FW32_BRANA|nr:BnaA09g20110D [Brassica napus]
MDSLSPMPAYLTESEAEGGGVPAPEQIEIKVPKNKVDLRNTIKNVRKKSRARIQLIPLEE